MPTLDRTDELAPAGATYRSAEAAGSNVRVSTYRFRDLLADPVSFDRLCDPDGYLGKGVSQWAARAASNPCAIEDDPAISLAFYGDRVVGRLGYVSGQAIVGGKTLAVLNLDGFYVTGEFRNTGAGAALMLAAIATKRPLVACGAPSKEAQLLYKRVGFRQIGKLRRFMFVNRVRPLVEWKLRTGYAAWLAASALQPFVSVRNGALSLRHHSRQASFVVEKVFRPSQASTNRLGATPAQWEWVASDRDIRQLSITIGDELAVSVVVGASMIHLPGARSSSCKAIRLLDYDFVDDREELRFALLRCLIDLAIQEGTELLELQLADNVFEHVAQRMGLWERGGNSIFVRPAARGAIPDPDEWTLRLSAGDVFVNF